MANRNTLHKSKLDGFKAWLYETGCAYRAGKGDYQVLQVQTNEFGWKCVYSRHNMPEHYTVDDKLYPLVRSFIEQTRQKPTSQSNNEVLLAILEKLEEIRCGIIDLENAITSR